LNAVVMEAEIMASFFRQHVRFAEKNRVAAPPLKKAAYLGEIFELHLRPPVAGRDGFYEERHDVHAEPRTPSSSQ
jgi:hypothetical protein